MPATFKPAAGLGLLAVAGMLACCSLSSGGHSSARAGEDLQPRPDVDSALAPFVARYCVDCHSGDEAEAGLALDRLLEAPSIVHRRRQWQQVLARVDRREMPPEDSEAPPDDERTRVLAWLREELAPPDCSQPQNPGAVTLRRLNRVEYQNTVRDLTGVDFDASALFPRDELAFGFDNNGDVLSLPTSLLEKYLVAARQIAEEALVAPESIRAPRQRFAHEKLLGGGGWNDGDRAQFVNGRIWAEARLDAPGEYLLRARVYATQAGDEPTRMRLFIDGERLAVVDVTADAKDPQVSMVRFHAKAGDHLVGVALVNDAWRPFAEDPQRRDRNLFVRSLTVVGPIEELAAENLPAGHRRLLSWTPSAEQWQDDAEWLEPTREQVGRLLIRAYRRPPTTDEIDRLIPLVETSRARGESFEAAMQLVLQATLASPQFLFRGEFTDDGRGVAGQEGVRELNDYELATRLSYFLWSTMPDDELLRVAADGRLRAELDAQIDRLLASPRADALIRNFGEQWLETRRLESLERNAELFPDFDDDLRAALREETFLLLRDVVRNDRPLSTLLTANYSFINSRLARHYGMEGPQGDEFVRTRLPRERRAGILGHGGVLALTSHEDRTSPVLRGKWVLVHLLADPPPPPPPGVSDLPDAKGELAGATLRQRLEVHRANPSCAVCHQRMDPLGISLENFDAVGRWRERDEGATIDAMGQLPDGRKFTGPQGLSELLARDFPQVRRALAQQLLIYALGRGLEPYDECAVKMIDDECAARGDTFGGMVRAIVHSAPFLKRNDGG